MMRVLRSIGAVVVGYLVFAFGAYAFFRLSGQAPHQPASTAIMLTSIAVGMAFAVGGGYLAAWLAGHHAFAHGIAVAAVLALGAAVSLFATLGKGAVWTQLAALLLMAPGAAVGGRLRARKPAVTAAAAVNHR